MKAYTSEFVFNEMKHKVIIVDTYTFSNPEKLNHIATYFDSPVCFVIIQNNGFDFTGEGTTYFDNESLKHLKWTPSKIS